MLQVKMHTSEILFTECKQIKPSRIVTTKILNKSFGLFCTKSSELIRELLAAVLINFVTLDLLLGGTKWVYCRFPTETRLNVVKGSIARQRAAQISNVYFYKKTTLTSSTPIITEFVKKLPP